MKELKDVEILLDEKTLRAKIDSDAFILQKLFLAIKGGKEKFNPRLWLQSAKPKLTAKQVDDLRMNLPKVAGVRQAGFPDAKGRILITLDLKKETRIEEIVAAASKIGVELADPKKGTPDKL